MGLDTVEVFMEIEDTFHISDFNPPIAPVPWDSITVDDLCERIWQRLQGYEPDWTDADATRLDEQVAPLRKATTAYLTALPRTWRWWRPTQLDRVIAPEHRVQAWSDIERIWGCSLPPLETLDGTKEPQIPASCARLPQMVGILVRRWIRQNEPDQTVWREASGPKPPNAEKWTRELVWEKLKQLLMEQLNLTANDVQPEATLIGDLKMG